MNPLVNYSSSSESDSDGNSKNHNVKKRINLNKVRLPLPKEIMERKLKAVNEIPCDNPDIHDKRTRSFKHERGNWATFVYIPVEICIIKELQESLQNGVKEVDLKSSMDIHISLTRTVVLQHHWIDSFIASVGKEFRRIHAFTITFRCLKIFCNEERTRTFIGLSVDGGDTILLKNFSKRLDLILKEYRLPEFYENAYFHSSILWCLGDHEQFFNSNLSRLETIVQSYFNMYPKEFRVTVPKILCKTGNKLFQFLLS